MSAVVFGAITALAWGLHDFLIRFVSRSISNFQSVFLVDVAGAIALFCILSTRGDALLPPAELYGLTTLACVAYTCGYVFLFLAFANGPVALVAPIVGSFPALVVAWAIANGAVPTTLDLLSVAGIVGGVGLVSRFAADEEASETSARPETRTRAILYAVISSVGLAIGLTAGQTLTHEGGPFVMTFATRLFGILIMGPLCWWEGRSFSSVKPWLPMLAVIAVLDIVGITAVVSAGGMDGAHMATVVASCFGAVTILLAVIFLKEKLTGPQTVGMGMILLGVAQLAGRY